MGRARSCTQGGASPDPSAVLPAARQPLRCTGAAPVQLGGEPVCHLLLLRPWEERVIHRCKLHHKARIGADGVPAPGAAEVAARGLGGVSLVTGVRAHQHDACMGGGRRGGEGAARWDTPGMRASRLAARMLRAANAFHRSCKHGRPAQTSPSPHSNTCAGPRIPGPTRAARTRDPVGLCQPHRCRGAAAVADDHGVGSDAQLAPHERQPHALTCGYGVGHVSGCEGATHSGVGPAQCRASARHPYAAGMTAGAWASGYPAGRLRT